MDPYLIEALMQKARRERAEAMHRLLVAPIKRLFTSRMPRPQALPRSRMKHA